MTKLRDFLDLNMLDAEIKRLENLLIEQKRINATNRQKLRRLKLVRVNVDQKDIFDDNDK